MTTWYRARAPLRLGFAGGGTDVSPYSDQFGGCVLNATIDLFAHCSISPRNDKQICFKALDCDAVFIGSPEEINSTDECLIFHKTIYHRIVRDFNRGVALPCNILTYADAPTGSGLGTSSTMVVAILGAFKEWLSLPIKKEELARLAVEIEREELGFAGGKQDHYSAVFGGINFIDFLQTGEVIVHPLAIDRSIINELQESLVLYYTGASRDSSKIISEQIHNVKAKVTDSVMAMHAIKENAINMKEYLMRGDLASFAQGVSESWKAKKRTASVISNYQIENIFEQAMSAGAVAGKVSGAGGGGHIMFMVDPSQEMTLERALQQCEGSIQRFHFISEGMTSWRYHALVK